MRKKILFAAGMVVVVIAALVCYFTGLAVFNGSMQMVTSETTGMEQVRAYMADVGFDLRRFESEYNIETICIESTLDGHMIPADLITTDGNQNKDTVVMVHGLGGNRLTVYPTAEIFLANGYNVLAFDQRSSGENTAPFTTYGYLESQDVKDYVAYLHDNIDSAKSIGVWGTSFGGATVGIYLGT